MMSLRLLLSFGACCWALLIKEPKPMGFYSSPHVLQQFATLNLYLMKIKEQTRKLAAGCSKECFEVVDRTDEVSNHIYGKTTLTRFEEIFEEH